MAGRVGSSMQSGPAVTCMKILLTIFNIIFWFSGIAILVLGVWTKVELHKYMELTTNYNNLTPYVMIAIGAGIVIIGSLGCCCTCKGKSGLLYLYAIILVVIFVAELAVAIGAFVYRSKMEDGFEKGLTDALNAYATDESKSEAVDSLQRGMSCCGKTNFTDWFSIDWDGKGVSTSVPASCCKDEDNCIHTEISPDMPDDADIYIEGCYTQISGFMEKNFGIIGAVAVGFAFLQLFGALIACCLAKNINKAKYEQVA